MYGYLTYILVESVRDDFFSYWLGLEGIITLFALLTLSHLFISSSRKTLVSKNVCNSPGCCNASNSKNHDEGVNEL